MTLSKRHLLKTLRIACLLACGSLVSQAQTIKLAKSPYVESFARANVSGNLLVGLQFGAVKGSFNPQGIGLSVSPQMWGKLACVEISSRDGRYFAQNLYAIPQNSIGVMYFDADTKYAPQLRAYSAEEMAVVAKLADDCNAALPERIVPVIVHPAAQVASPDLGVQLVAYLNAEPDRLTVLLSQNGVDKGTAHCGTAEGAVRVSFTSSCEISGPNLSPGAYDLLVRVREHFKTVDSHYRVLVPAHDNP